MKQKKNAICDTKSICIERSTQSIQQFVLIGVNLSKSNRYTELFNETQNRQLYKMCRQCK